MALKVRDLTSSAEKLVQRAQSASQEYATNAAAAGSEWERGASAAADAFGAAITQGGMKQRFLSGVRRAGASKYARKITAVGAGRFSEGVAAGQNDYVAGVQPYFQALASLSLAARQPRGSKANQGRSAAVADALHAKRLAMLGGTQG